LRLADRVAVLLDGRIVQSGPPEQVYRRPVSLEAARILGPACELAGQARDGLLTRDGQTVLAGLDRALTGPASLILRPEDLAFQADPAGQAVVTRSDLAVGGWLIHAESAAQAAVAFCDRPLPPGARGWLRMRTRPV